MRSSFARAGIPLDATRFAWPSARAIAVATERALRALRTRYGAYVATGPATYAGFSQGAILAREALLAVPGRFRIAVLAAWPALVKDEPAWREFSP